MTTSKIKNLWVNLVQDESGATAIEYGLIASLIAVAIIVSVTQLGNGLKTTFGRVTAQIK